MTEQKQEIPEGYKQTEVGVIPRDWAISPMSQLTILMTNGFVGTAKSHYTDSHEGITYIQGYNVEENSFNFHGIKKVTPEFHKKNSKSCLKTGDVLMVQTGDVGLVTIVPPELEGANCHALIINRYKQNLDPKFFSFYFNSLQGRMRLKELETGTTMKHINVGDLLQFLVPYPIARNEQTAIANALSDVDALIAELEKLIAKKQAIKTATMQQLLTGKTRLPEFALRENGTPKGYKQSELGEMPEDWELCTLEQMAAVGGLVRGPFGGAIKKEYFVKNGYKIYEQRNAIYSTIDIGDYFIDTNKYQELKRFSVKPYDFIVSCSGTIGKIFQIPSLAPEGVINQALLKITLSEKVNPQYFLHVFKWDRFQDKIIDGIQGGAMKNLVGMSEFKKSLMAVSTSKQEQTTIASILSDMDDEIQTLQQRLNKTRQIKQGMMQELLTGKTRLI